MKALAEKWERSSEKLRQLAQDADHHPTRQQGLFASSEVYGVCASDLRRKLKETKQPKEV